MDVLTVLVKLCTLLGGLFLSVVAIVALIGVCSVGWDVVEAAWTWVKNSVGK